MKVSSESSGGCLLACTPELADVGLVAATCGPRTAHPTRDTDISNRLSDRTDRLLRAPGSETGAAAPQGRAAPMGLRRRRSDGSCAERHTARRAHPARQTEEHSESQKPPKET